MKIAFFDSGVGGLTVLQEALKRMPGEDYIYYGDSDHAPYGTKTKEEIKGHVFRSVEFLAQMDLKALVLACNTATSVTVDDLRKMYSFPIIGMEPAVKLAVKNTKNQKIIVCATNVTLKEGKLSQLVSNLNATEMVEYLPLQELVMFAENFDLESPEVIAYIQKKFSSFNWNEFDSIVLGCTHFIYFRHLIRQFVPKEIQILDGNEGTIKNLASKITLNSGPKAQEIPYFISGRKADKGFFDRYLRFLNQYEKAL